MRRKEQLIDHGLIKLFLFALVMLTPFTAWAQTLTVGGVDATDADALQTAYGTTVSFNSSTNTLTLNGATIVMSETSGYCPIESSIANLTIQLIGYNKLTPNSDNFYGIKFTEGTTTGNLTFTTSNVVEEYGSLSVDGIYQFSDLTSGYNVTNSFTTGEQTGWSKTESGGSGQTYNSVRIDYTEYYDVWVGGARLSSSSLSPVSGGTKYIPSTHTLHLAGYGYDNEIKSGLPEFIVEVSGSNNSVSNITFEGNTPGTIIFKKDESSVSGNKVDFTGSVKGFSSVTITPPLQLVSPSGVDNPTSAQWNSFTNVSIADFTTTYNIIVAGVQVTDQNAEDILGNGTVSYDAENHKLTLNNANLTSPINWGIDADLTIELKGTNSMNTSEACISSVFEREISFTGGGDNGSLELSTVTDDYFFSGFSNTDNPSMGTGMYWIPTWNDGNMTSVLITNSLLGGGKGTEGEPFIISTFDHLKTFAKYVNDGILSTEYIKLGASIECPTNETGFEPIGNSNSFIGTFNGDGNSITGLIFSNTDQDGVAGLFGNIGKFNNGEITRGTVKNLTLSGCQFGNGARNGAIAGNLAYGTIENCTVTSCTISSGNSQSTFSGGITGIIEGNGIVKDCSVNGGTITSSTSDTSDGEVCAGGIVAEASGSSEINGCTVTDVSINSTCNRGHNSYSGGIVGSSQATISGNSVEGTTTVNSINNENNETYAGAIVANKTGGLLTENYYDFTVKTKTTIGNNDPVEKFGYTERAVGGSIYNEQTQQEEPNPDITANNGAVMYTKTLTVGVSNECESYEPLTDYENGVLAFAPGQTIDIYLYPADGVTISAASLVYTPAGGTEQTVPLENESETAGEYNYVFEMPDANATLTTTIVQSYALWIGETQVTDANKNHILGEGNTTVTFAVTGNEAAGYVNTLTLNGAALTVPVKVGLANLTIDIQGSNTITTNTTCIQNTATTGTPSLTFKSTSDVVGSLTLKNNDEDYTGVISESFYSNNTSYYTISRELALIMLRYGNYTSNTNYFTAGEVHDAQLVPSYGVQVNDMQVYEGNSTNVLGDGKVSFDKTTHTLTLNNANGIEGISTTLSTLDIDLVGSNSLYRSSNGSLFESASGDAVTINLKSTGATGALTMETPANFGATLIGENVTLIPVDPIEELSRDVAENKGTLVYGVDYDLSVGGVQVTSANASNVLGGETATVVFTPADNTTSPATLTLNGATIAGSILSGLENLRVVINGTNTAEQVLANTDVDGDKNITFAGGTNGGTLTIDQTGGVGSAVSEFASVSYDGAYPAADVPFGYGKPDSNSPKGYVKSHMMGDNSYLETLTITTVPHYPIWLYTNVTTSTQVDNTNKNTLLGASGDVSFDGNHTLSLKNSVNSTARIVSGLSELTISIDGDCIIESPDSGSVVRSINSSAPLTIEKASGASSASLKLAAVSFTAIKAFASLDYTGLILLSEGATYSSGALNGSKGEPLNVANFTTGLKKPTIQMNYENDTYSFNNPNEGGTLKYSRYFANNEYPDEENQIDNGTTTFQIFKNGRQYNDPLTVICEVWVEANGNSSDKLYACRLDVKDMIATYGGTVPTPEFLPKAIEGVTVSGYSLGDHTEVAATVTEGNITLTGAGRQELDAIFSIPDGVEYIKTSTTETPKATFFLDVKPATPILSKATGSYAGTQTITVTNLTPNATAMYYTYEGEEPENPNAQAFPEGGVDISSSKTLAVYYVASYETETSTEYLYSETVRETYTILEDPELAYKQGETAVTTAEWILGKDENVLPTLYNPYDLAPVTYESNNTDVATVATDGTVTVVGIGTAVITATTAETDVYVAGEASYTLTVKRQLDVSFSTSNEWATYCGTENLAMPEGLKAYQVTAVDGSTVTIGEIGYIPANTAVLLQNVSNNNVWTNIAASAYTGATSTFENNKLIGTASAVDVSTITGGTVYILVNNMFRRSTSGSIPANRGYLVVAPSSGNAPQLSISIGDENTTAISNTDFTDNTDKAGEWYSIDGVKLNGQPQKPGLYIKNGKKVFINKK